LFKGIDTNKSATKVISYTPIASSPIEISNNMPIPGFQRMFYLPPGQAGAVAVKTKVASWVTFFKNCAWVPAKNPMLDSLTVVRPCEAVLDDGKLLQDNVMPIALFSRPSLAAVRALPREILQELAFGTGTVIPIL
jgi:hypothetical protein